MITKLQERLSEQVITPINVDKSTDAESTDSDVLVNVDKAIDIDSTDIDSTDINVSNPPIRLTIDITDETILFDIQRNGINTVAAYNLAKLMIDLEKGKPIIIQNLIEIMPEDEMSNLILQHYLSMRSHISRPCISPSEIFNTNRAQDMRE